MDPGLVRQAQQGNQVAFEAIAVASHLRLLRIAHGVLRERGAAEDATQQALIEIWRWLPRLRDPERFDGFSYRILLRACQAEVKRRPGWSSHDSIDVTAHPRTPDPTDTVLARDELERGFRRLSADHRAIIVMRHLLDLPMEDVAEALDIPIGTVASRLNRAMDALRAALEADSRPGHPMGLQPRRTP
jgi:RNA polymerase sigma-70 factor (ECF subfamily)